MLTCFFNIAAAPGSNLTRRIRLLIDKPQHSNFENRSVPFLKRFSDSRIPHAIQFAVSTGLDSVVLLGDELMSHKEYQRRVDGGLIKHQ